MNPYLENRLHTFAIKSSIFVVIAYVILTAFSMFLGNSDLPLLLRIVYGLSLFFWFIWTIAIHIDKQNQQKYEKEHYIFDIDKAQSVLCRHPDANLSAVLRISDFMDAYNMCEADFKSKIVLHGIELAIQEYVNEHPESLVYHSGHSFDE